jgi:hypothetical protein
MNRGVALQSLYDNLHRPTMKPLSKTKEGRRYRKAFERKARTPAQRVLEDPSVPEERKTRVENPLAQNDPIALGREIDKALKAMWKAISAGKGSPSGTASGGGSALRAAPSGTPSPEAASNAMLRAWRPQCKRRRQGFRQQEL